MRRWLRHTVAKRALQTAFPATDVERGALQGLLQASAPSPQTLQLLKPQQQLADLLNSHTQRLVDGVFFQNNGSHVRVVMGTPGCGMTTVMQAHVQRTCAQQAASVVVVSMCGRQGLQGTLADVATTALRARGVHVGTYGTPLYELTYALQESGLRLLVLVDHLDDLFRTNPANPGAFCAAWQTLQQVASLADTFHGMVGIMMCGSSTLLPSLVAGAYTFQAGEMSTRFPVVPYVGDMNDSRVRTVVLSPLLPTNVAAAGMCHGFSASAATGDGELSRVARVRLFLAGATLRGRTLLSETASAMPASVDALPTLEKVFLHNLLAALRRKNDFFTWTLHESLCQGKGRPDLLDVDLVASGSWERFMQPLTGEDVLQAWAVSCGQWEDKQSPMTARMVIDKLCAAGALVVDYTSRDSWNMVVYPASAAQLFCTHSTHPTAMFQRFFPPKGSQ